MIRPATAEDANALIGVAVASGLFEKNETEELAGMLADHFSLGEESREFWIADDDGGPVGVAYVAPERMTVGTWNLYLIAVHPERQRQRRGTALLAYVEQLLTERGARVLLVETSGLSDFEYVRAFYRRNGYDEEARIREFYQAGEDKIVFRKALAAQGK